MSPELTHKLISDFPDMFSPKFYFECGDGWFDILYSLCANIAGHIKHKKKQKEYNEQFNKDVLNPNFVWQWKHVPREVRPVPDDIQEVTVSQVKEKFGGLRFYFMGGDDYIDGLVRMAESWADKTCEVCGNPGENKNHRMIMMTRCKDHMPEGAMENSEIP